jgi:hypothetical protein
MRARNLFGLFSARRRRSPQPPKAAPDRDLVAAEVHSFFASETYKDALGGLIKAAFADGQDAERKRVSEVLNAPGAALFPTVAMDLALGAASGAQAAAVLTRAETDAAKRAGLMKSNPLESSSGAPTVH